MKTLAFGVEIDIFFASAHPLKLRSLQSCFIIVFSYFKAGETLAFEVEIEGEPPAHDIVWTLNGKGAIHKLR